MNQQIKELVEQAGAEELGAGSDLYGGPFIGAIRMDFLEKFAELIVRECANVAAEHDALDIYEEIREHFGVEE